MTSHEDPAADSAARATQLAAMALSVAEGVARLRAERLAARAVDDGRRAAELRAQARADQAARWLAEAGPAAPHDGEAPASARPEPVAVAIVCTPRDLADQAFPIGMPEAMATAPQAAQDAVRRAGVLAAGVRRASLTASPGSAPTPGSAPR
jgi:hypothetical protein